MTADPVPPAARTEFERLARRWRQLPLDRALAHVPDVVALAQSYADAVAAAAGREGRPLPDLGPGVVIDQLVVTAYDLAAAAGGAGAGERLVEDLAGLRRRIG